MGNSNNKSSLRKSQSVPDTQRLEADAPVFDKQKSVSQHRLNQAHDKPGKAGKKNKQPNEELPQLNPAEASFLPEFPLRGDLEELEFDILDVIARGAFGNVIKVQTDEQKKIFAVKVLDKAQIIEEGAIRQCKDEATIQSMAGQHPFVVKAHEYWQSRRSLYIVLDYVPHGDMFTLWTFHGAFPENLVQLYIAEMAMVIDFLHNASVIYRDIKMENILFNAKGHIQLTDFGLAKWLKGGDQTRTVCGTLQYMAPEVLSVYPYSHPADWWSLGILMFAMLAGRYPVDGAETHTKMAQRVFECDFLLPSHISDSAQDVINRVLTKSPHKRLSDVNSLQDLDFFQEIFFSNLIEQKLNPLDVVPEDFFPMTGQSWAPPELTDEEQGHFDQFDDGNSTLTEEPGYPHYPHYHMNPASHHHPEPVHRVQPSQLSSQQTPQEHERQYSSQSELHQQPHLHDQPSNLQPRQLPHRKSFPDFQRASTDLDVVNAGIPSLRDDRRLEQPTSDYNNLQADSSKGRQSSISQPGYDGRSNVVPQAGYDGRSNVVPQPGYDGRSNLVPQSGYDGRSNVLHQPGYDGKSNAVPQPGYDGRSNVPQFGNDGRSNVVPQPGYDGRSNVVPQPGYDGRSNVVPQPGYDGKSNVPQSGYDGRNNVVPKPGYDGRSNVVPQIGYDGRSNVVPQSGYDGRSNVVPQPGYDGRSNVVPQSGYDGRSNVVPQNNFDANNERANRNSESFQRSNTSQDRRSYGGSSNSQSSLNNAGTSKRTNDDPGLASMSSAQSWNNINSLAGSTNRLSAGPEYKTVEAAPTVTLKSLASQSSLQTRYNQTPPGYSSQTSLGNPTPSGYALQKQAVGINIPAHEVNYEAQVSDSRINSQAAGFSGSNDSKYLDQGYKILEAPPTVSVPSAQIRFSNNPSVPQNRDLQRLPPTSNNPSVPQSRDLQRLPPTSNNFPNNFSSGSTNLSYTGSDYHTLEQATVTIKTAPQISAPQISAAHQRPSVPTKPVPPQKPTLGPKPAIPVKPIPAPRQSLRTNHSNGAPESQAGLTNNRRPSIPAFSSQHSYSSVANHDELANSNIASGAHQQGWSSQALPAADQVRDRSASMSNMLTSSGRPDSTTRSPSIDDQNFQWKLPAGTTPSFV